CGPQINYGPSRLPSGPAQRYDPSVRLHRLKRVFVGSPIPTAQSRHERLRKTTALPIFASDALSSVAYATEELLLMLILAGASAAAVAPPLPALFRSRVWLCVVAVVLVGLANLRGIRESGKFFAAPTYLFVVSLFAMVVYGALGAIFDFLPEHPYEPHAPGLE